MRYVASFVLFRGITHTISRAKPAIHPVRSIRTLPASRNLAAAGGTDYHVYFNHCRSLKGASLLVSLAATS
jgi:hypothetical protein